MFGYSQEELVGTHISRLHGSQEQLGIKYFEQLMSGMPLRTDLVMKHKDGHEFPIQFSAVPIEDGGRINGVTGSMTDITDRKQAQAKLMESNQRLEEALMELRNTLEQLVQQESLKLATIASEIAHDFNNSLAPILGLTALMLEHPDILEDKNKTLRFLKGMSTSAVDASEIVSRMWEFDRYPEAFNELLDASLNHFPSEAAQTTQPNWEINIESELDQGTTDVLRLPAQSSGPSTHVARTEDKRSLHILAVDDELLSRELLIEYLRRDGHTVETASGGREALDKVMQSKFDLILINRSMPAMGGEKLAGAIKNFAPDMPMVMVTGYGDMMNAIQERLEGIDIILNKPINPAMLRQALDRLFPSEKFPGHRNRKLRSGPFLMLSEASPR